MPEDPWPHMGIAAAFGQLHHQEMARAAIEWCAGTDLYIST
jgi:hypothetical protein